MSDAIEFVAEHIMGFERKRCQGVYGGGNITTAGSETWFWCNWCSREVPDGTAGPCPRYPFPRFSMRNLMARLGDLGHHTMMRFDPERDRHRFTVCLNGQRVGDTDEPLEALCEHFARRHENSGERQHRCATIDGTEGGDAMKRLDLELTDSFRDIPALAAEVGRLRRELHDEQVRRDEWEKMYDRAVAGTEPKLLRGEIDDDKI